MAADTTVSHDDPTPVPTSRDRAWGRHLVFPPHTNAISDTIAQLSRAGGVAQRDFWVTYVDNNIAVEATPELYRMWLQPAPTPAPSTPEPSTPDGDPTPSTADTTPAPSTPDAKRAAARRKGGASP